MEVTAIRLAAVTTLLGLSNWCSRHWDNAIVRGKMAAAWAPLIKRHREVSKSGFDVWLCLWRVLAGKDNPLLMLRR
jgi:hypothetical protein